MLDRLSFFDRIDIRYKMFWLVLVISFSIFFNGLNQLSLILVGVFAWSLLSSPPTYALLGKLKAISPFILIILIFTMLIRPGKPIFAFYGISFSSTGLKHGLTYTIRLITFVSSFSLVTSTSSSSEFLELLKKMKLPYPLIIAFLITLRFVPTMKKKHHKLIEAQRTRGINLNKLNWLKKLKIEIKSLIPVFIDGVMKSERLAMALLTRGFSGFKEKTKFHKLKTTKTDLIFISITLTQFSLQIYLKIN
ncbi:MAG: Energy-coupling factor transporter transmembrane protein EcfT [Candidatus Methanohalarchaeum thermophilum]|uniref:Energy-coupling factor transporter transmembrane protein EcfT n=1 Tax=Methanohalarchaeum thermophilum TaxID=1903181 RepID=A0A1Q6DT26_METT1|nr:MAG: Energy-coupling factor transporter transmembrane protein EcfT [Candidatus Methanohalarchaeum thermophilum]